EPIVNNLVMELKEAIENGDIVVAPAPRAEFLVISMKNRNPPEAVSIVQAFLDQYMRVIDDTSLSQEEKRLKTLESSRTGLSEKLERLYQELREKAQEYGSVSLEGPQYMLHQNLNNRQMMLLDLEKRKLDLEARMQVYYQPQDPNILLLDNIMERNDAINNHPNVQQTSTVLIQLKQALILDRQVLQEGHPDLTNRADMIKTLNEQLKQYRQEAGKEFDEIMAQSQRERNKNNLILSQMELALVEKQLLTYREKQDQEAEEAQGMGTLQFQIQYKQAEIAREESLHKQIADRINVLELESDKQPQISISDGANTGPPTTRRVIYLALLLVVALVCGLFFAFVLGKADKSLYTPEDVIRCIGVPIIGTTCDLTQVEKKLIPEQVAEDYHTIRANLGLLSDGNIPHKLVITSAGMREGKSTFAVNLATSLAQAGKRVLLIDGDFRKPDLKGLLNLPNGSWGIQDVLFGLRKFEETVRSVPLSSGLDVLLANGSNSAETIELLEKPQTAECINNISQKYDHVIIDTPPVLAVPDALLWARMADAVVLSSLAGETESPALQDALERLNKINVKVLGNVLGNVRTSDAYHRYSYGYGYGRVGDGGNGGKKSRRRRDESPMLSTSEPDQNAKNRSNT
ncbi:polysaccharide biosynthesis tyrosine autokinase, partial [Planctomycetota bacterium]